MIYNPKIFLDKSPVHGWGVFAKEDIESGEVFEECPILPLPMKYGEVSEMFIDYRFNWPQGVNEWEQQSDTNTNARSANSSRKIQARSFYGCSGNAGPESEWPQHPAGIAAKRPPAPRLGWHYDSGW